MRRRHLLLAAAAVAVVVLAPQLLRGRTTQPAPVVQAPVATMAALAPATSLPIAAAAPDCDPATALFVTMFVRLSAVALANAGIDRDAFAAQLAADRELFRDYLDSLGVVLDDARLDALLQGVATSSAVPSGSLGRC